MAKKQRRALVPTGIVILAVLSGVNYFFAPVDSATASGGNGSGIQQNPVYSTRPEDSVRAVYQYIAYNFPDSACNMFTVAGQQAFARDLGAPDCKQAAQRVHDSATDTKAYYVPDIPASAILTTGPRSTIDSCKMTVTGGQRLGVFKLSKNASSNAGIAGGWVITDHTKSDPADCATG